MFLTTVLHCPRSEFATWGVMELQSVMELYVQKMKPKPQKEIPSTEIPEELINDQIMPFSQEWAKENMGL